MQEEEIIKQIEQEKGQKLQEISLDLNLPKMFSNNYTEEFKKYLSYKGDKNDIKQRLKHKIFNIWNLWNNVSKDENLARVISDLPEKNTDEYYLKQSFFYVIEQIAFILNNTDIIEEIIDNKDVMQFKK